MLAFILQEHLSEEEDRKNTRKLLAQRMTSCHMDICKHQETGHYVMGPKWQLHLVKGLLRKEQKYTVVCTVDDIFLRKTFCLGF